MTQQETNPTAKSTEGSEESVFGGIYFRILAVFTAIILLFLVAYELVQDLRLAISGTSTIAVVTDYVPTQTKKGGTIHYHTIETSNGQVLKVQFDAPQATGTQTIVTYLADTPDVVRVGDASASQVEFISEQITWGTLFLLALGLGFAWIGFTKGRDEKLLQRSKILLRLIAFDKIRAVIVVAITALLGSLIYPPFVIQRPNRSWHAGFDWIFSSRVGTVNVPLLLAEWLAILLLAGLVVYLLKSRK